MNLSPLPIQRFYNNLGLPLVGGKLFTYIAGSTTKIATYSDSSGTLNTNPVRMNFRGECRVWLDPTLTYKFVLSPSSDTDPPTNPIWTVDNIAAGLAIGDITQQFLGQIIYPRTAAEISASVVPTYYIYPPLNVHRYGAVGDGVTDDTLALRKAQSVADVFGGTVVLGEGNTYLLSTKSTYSVVVPVSDSNFQPTTQDMQYHVLIQNQSNITWEMNGSTLKSTITDGGTIFLLDGARNVEFRNGWLESVTAKDASGNVTTAGMGAWSCTSQARDSYGLAFHNLICKDIYYTVYTFGDPASSFRVHGVDIDTIYHDQGVYTLAFHDNGDNINARAIYSHAADRELFVYGCDQVNVEMQSDTAFGGFASNIKAYDRDTTRIKYRLRTTKSSTAYNVNLETQHAPAVQATPCRLIDIDLDVDNRGNASNQVAVGFQYYRDNTPTATSNNNLWTGIKLSGIHLLPPVINSTQIGTTAAYGTLNVDDLVLVGGSLNSLFSGTGFLDTKNSTSTFTPIMKIGGSTTGITYAGTTAAYYYRSGRFVDVFYRIVLTNTGGLTGTVTLDLPLNSAVTAFDAVNAMVLGDGQANMAGLSGPISGFVAIGGSTLTLRVQGAAASASLTDANLTNTSDFRIWARYPIS